MSDLIRSSTLTGFSQLVLELGGDPGPMLRYFNWSDAMIEQGDAQISYRALMRLLEIAAAKLDCKDFGLRLASHQGLNILGPLAIIMLNSKTVGEAWASMIRQMDHYSPVCITRLDTKSIQGKAIHTFDAAIAGAPNRQQAIEKAIGISFRDLQVLTGGRFAPTSVMFRHAPVSPLSTYRKFFGVQVKFEQEINGIIFPASDLKWPLKSNNPALRQIVVEYVQQSIPSSSDDFEPQVIVLIKHLLPQSNVNLRLVARHLCVHERTLQRRLELQGKSFEGILDAVRRQRAEDLLTESRLSMAQIAERLGYVEQSSFNKACRRWFGSPPLKVRAQRLARSTGFTRRERGRRNLRPN